MQINRKYIFFLLSVYDLFKDDKTFYNLFDEVSEFNVG